MVAHRQLLERRYAVLEAGPQSHSRLDLCTGLPHVVRWLMNELCLGAGRPVDVAQTRDNSLLVSDDKAGVVYRISYNTSFEAAAAAAAATPVTAYQGPP